MVDAEVERRKGKMGFFADARMRALLTKGHAPEVQWTANAIREFHTVEVCSGIEYHDVGDEDGNHPLDSRYVHRLGGAGDEDGYPSGFFDDVEEMGDAGDQEDNPTPWFNYGVASYF